MTADTNIKAMERGSSPKMTSSKAKDPDPGDRGKKNRVEKVTIDESMPILELSVDPKPVGATVQPEEAADQTQLERLIASWKMSPKKSQSGEIEPETDDFEEMPKLEAEIPVPASAYTKPKKKKPVRKDPMALLTEILQSQVRIGKDPDWKRLEPKPKASFKPTPKLKSPKPEDSKPKDSKPKDSKPKDSKAKDSKPKDSKPKDSKPKDLKPEESDPKTKESTSTHEESEVMIRTIFPGGKRLQFNLKDEAEKQTLFKILRKLDKIDKFADRESGKGIRFESGWLDKDFSDMKDIKTCIETYNDLVKLYRRGLENKTAIPEHFGNWGEPKCDYGIAKFIVNCASDCAVPNPQELNNHYASFSSETYGETNFSQMASICKEMNIGKDDVFVDLGSGIGKLVCFVSAYARCKKSVGIELSAVPAKFADKLGEYYKGLMKFFGKKHGDLELHQGDMLDKKFRHLITNEATVIFINNIQFDEKLMLKLKDILQYVNRGTRIVTTKALSDTVDGPRASSREEFNTFCVTEPLKTVKNNVSWTGKEVPFWMSTVDMNRLTEPSPERSSRRMVRKCSADSGFGPGSPETNHGPESRSKKRKNGEKMKNGDKKKKKYLM